MMRKRFLICLCVMILGVLSAAALTAGAAGVPTKVTMENVALGKDVSFRSFDDFSEVQMYDYFYDYNGIDETGAYALTGNHMTDGERVVSGGSSMNSNMGTRLCDEPNMAWAYIDLGQQEVINKVHFYVVGTWHVNRAIIQLSEDGTNWTTVYSTTAIELKDSKGNTIYNDGLVNLDCLDQNSYIDFRTHLIGCMTINPAGGGYPIEFNATKARYVRMTNLISELTNGGSSNNTVFTEIEVYAAKDGIMAPSASLKSDNYEALGEVTLSAAYDGAEIYYTLDGSYPTENSTKYTAPIDLSGTTSGSIVLRAITVLSDGQISYPANYEYKIEPPANLALNKTMTFRELGDVTKTIDMYNYWPDGNGSFESSVYNFSGNYLTDGDFTWMSLKSNCTAPGVVGWAYLDMGQSYVIGSVGINFLGGWAFENIVIQASNDAAFASGVTTIFANALAPIKDSAGNEVYDGTIVVKSGQPHISVNKQYIYSENKQHIFAADNVSARYIRITNVCKPIGGQAEADNNTLFCEIQVFYGGAAAPTPVHTTGIVSFEMDTDFETSYASTTAKQDIIDSLPATADFIDNEGNEYTDVALSWSCAEWVDGAAGTFTVVASYTLNGVENPYDIALEAVITVKHNTTATVAYTGSTLYTSSAFPTAAAFEVTCAQDGVLTLTQKALTAGTVTVDWTFTPTDNDYNVVTGTVDLSVTAVTLTSIEITTNPTKTAYIEGNSLNLAGMVVTAYYNDGTSEPVTEYTVDKTAALTTSDTVVTVTFGVETDTFNITVAQKSVVSIEITTEPTKKAYIEGNTLDMTGAVVKATYDNGEVITVTEYTVDKTAALTTTDTVVTVTFGGETDTFNITVAQKSVVSIEITTEPTKKAYIEGNTLDITGAVVKATYDNGEVITVTDYTVDKTAALTTSDTVVTVTFGGESDTFNITVAQKSVVSIAITAEPTKKAYDEGDSLDLTGMVVTATYDNGDVIAVTDYTVDKTAALTTSDTTVKVTFGGAEATFTITVTAKKATSSCSGSANGAGGMVSALIVFLGAEALLLRRKQNNKG